MRLQNTSRYPADEVRRLVEFAMRGVRTERLEVHVKNSRHAYRGMAYHGVPSMSSAHGKATVDRLVTIGIGPAGKFPCDNMDETFGPYRDVQPGETWDASTHKWRRLYERGGHRDQIAEVRRHPYGGIRSPLIVLHNWREALVAVAAHEARHVWQQQRGKRGSEVDAEKWAARKLTEYRASIRQEN